MRVGSGSAGQRWQSFHVFLPRDFDGFLTKCVSPMVERELNEGRVKRFFFIRYSEGGNHLRLRFLPGSGTKRAAIGHDLTCLTRRFAEESGLEPESCYVLEEAYDRIALYFGETLLSVYSELLNEQTSYLALRILRSGSQSRPLRLVTVGSILALLTRRAARSSEETAGFIDQSCRFAREALSRMGVTVAHRNRDTTAQLHSALGRSIPKLSQLLEADSTTDRIARLLTRMRKRQLSGAAVAVHGLHLLCNKLGVSLTEEHELFTALCQLVD